MKQLSHIKEKIVSVLKGGDILLIVPPFTTVRNPLMGVHILQSLAAKRGYKAEILYLNVLLTPMIGDELTDQLTHSPFEVLYNMISERLFARVAYDFPALGITPEYCTDEAMSVSGSKHHHTMFYNSVDFELDEYLEIENICSAFVDEAIPAIASLNYKIIGCTQRVGQTNCSIALLNGIKCLQPDVVTITGGSNCSGEMAQGIASLTDSIDYIFSGESESSFCRFLESYSKCTLPSQRIILGEPLKELDSLALPDYTCFIEQTECFRGKDALPYISLIYETSRGCWWGEKQACRFCSEEKAFRQKTARKTLEDLKQICRQYQPEGIYMSDVSMPLSFHEEVFPKLVEREKELPRLYYQFKSNLQLPDLINLKKANVGLGTVGIEAISAGLLKLMNKGITGWQNVKFLRCTRSVKLHVDWLLLWGFPGDKIEYYQETLDILPLIRHLQPPITLMHVFLTRFSPYFSNAKDFKITNLRPWAVYDMIFPDWAEKDKLASWFIGDYPCEAHENPQLIKAISEEVVLWKKLWRTTRLVMVPFQDYYIIFDNRDIVGNKQTVIDACKAKEIMKTSVYNESEYQKWALTEKYGVLMDSWYVPLVTASPELLQQFEA